MISPETAKQLRELGLERRLELGDYCADNSHSPPWIYLVSHCNNAYFELTRIREELWRISRVTGIAEYLWLPSLEQILEEIERRDYDYQLEPDGCMIERKDNPSPLDEETGEPKAGQEWFWGGISNPTETAGLALAQILEGVRGA